MYHIDDFFTSAEKILSILKPLGADSAINISNYIINLHIHEKNRELTPLLREQIIETICDHVDTEVYDEIQERAPDIISNAPYDKSIYNEDLIKKILLDEMLEIADKIIDEYIAKTNSNLNILPNDPSFWALKNNFDISDLINEYLTENSNDESDWYHYNSRDQNNVISAIFER